jgi:hypothetical protein
VVVSGGGFAGAGGGGMDGWEDRRERKSNGFGIDLQFQTCKTVQTSLMNGLDPPAKSTGVYIQQLKKIR